LYLRFPLNQFMKTILVDILDEKAFKLLRDLEVSKLIKLRGNKLLSDLNPDWAVKYKGAMTKQSSAEIENQLKNLREWE
jgi:hypothetical protein